MKIFLEKGKYFLVFGCILKIVLENREVDRERYRNRVRGGRSRGGDDEIDHGWVKLDGGGYKIERGGRDMLQRSDDKSEMTRLRSRWQ